jgi:hypothetical protein
MKGKSFNIPINEARLPAAGKSLTGSNKAQDFGVIGN